MILVDLNYWEGNQGRLYTDVLQDPLRARPSLPKQEVEANRKMQEGVERALAELRTAVAASKRLQEEASRRGRDWLRKYVSVHLNVMNPADFSYRTRRLVGYLPIAPDTIVRDHRKIILYDVTELEPGKGAAIYGGVGVGRAVRLRHLGGPRDPPGGPAALSVKDAARRYLKQNGFRDENIPFPLRPLPRPADYDQRVQALGRRELDGHGDGGAQRPGLRGEGREHRVGRALHADAARQPDRRAGLDLDARAVGGAAIRAPRCAAATCTSSPPRLRTRPPPASRSCRRTREIWSRFIEARKILGPEIADRGGRLRVGLYTREGGVDDLQAQLAEMHQAFERYSVPEGGLPVPRGLLRGRREGRGAARLDRLPARRRPPAGGRARAAPKMHRKTQLFVTGGALAAIVSDPRTQEVIRGQTRFIYRQGIVFEPEELAKARIDLGRSSVRYLDVFRELPDPVREKAILCMTVGSLNKDARGMMTDGEVLQVTAGAWAMWAVADMWILTGSTTWIDSQEELDRLLPPYKQVAAARVGRWVRKVI